MTLGDLRETLGEGELDMGDLDKLIEDIELKSRAVCQRVGESTPGPADSGLRRSVSEAQQEVRRVRTESEKIRRDLARESP